MEDNIENATSVDVDDSNSFLESELEALQSIYLNELEIKSEDDKKSTCVFINLHPATADKQEEQYVKMTLRFTLNEDYPHTIPKISIHNPRGLSEEKINSTYQDLMSIAENKIGSSMLFEIIEAAKEQLTAGNRPCGECAICLYGFSESDVFTKTDCYHYFHSHCLARYAKDTAEDEDNSKEDKAKELLCPMCRVPIAFSGAAESFPPPSAAEEEVVTATEEMAEMQRKMADLYQRQLDKGGIIDVEAEKNKFLLEISNIPTVSNAPEKSEAAAEETETPSKSDESSPQPQSDKSEAKDSKSERVRNEDRPKNRNNRGNNYPRNRRDWYNDHDDRNHDSRNSGYPNSHLDSRNSNSHLESRNSGYSSSHFDTRNSGYSNSRDNSYRRDGPRRDRGTRNRRGNPRYPRRNEGPYYPNQRQRSHTENRKSDENGREESPLSDSSPKEEVPTSMEEITEQDPSREYERRGKNRGRGNSRGGPPRGRGGYRGRNDNYDRRRNDFGERRNYNDGYRRDGEFSKPQEESFKDSQETDAAKAEVTVDSAQEAHNESDEKREDSNASRGRYRAARKAPEESSECAEKREDVPRGRYRGGRGSRPYNGKGFQGEPRFQGERREYDDRRYQQRDNFHNRGGYRENQQYRGYGDRRQNHQEVDRDRKTEDKPVQAKSPVVPRKEPDAMNGAKVKGFATERPPPGFNDPKKKVVYGQESFNAPPGFPRR